MVRSGPILLLLTVPRGGLTRSSYSAASRVEAGARKVKLTKADSMASSPLRVLPSQCDLSRATVRVLPWTARFTAPDSLFTLRPSQQTQAVERWIQSGRESSFYFGSDFASSSVLLAGWRWIGRGPSPRCDTIDPKSPAPRGKSQAVRR